MTYYIVTDDVFDAEYKTLEEAIEYIEQNDMHPNDFTLIEGKEIKIRYKVVVEENNDF